MRQKKREGSVIIPAGLDVWKHELKTAQAFARDGYTVQFLVRDQTYRMKSADVLIDNVIYEIKAPKADKLSAIERNLKRATRQSANIIIDSRRMSKIHDLTIQNFLKQKLKQQKSIKKLLLVNRKHKIIDISTLVWYYLTTEVMHGAVCSYRKASFLLYLKGYKWDQPRRHRRILFGNPTLILAKHKRHV